MQEGITWRLISDYIGAGEFLLTSNRAFVGTEYGVQCLPYSPDNLKDWKTELGSRCIGVRAIGKEHILASCVEGVFLLSREGEVEEELLSADNFVYPTLVTSDAKSTGSGQGYLVTTRTGLQYRSSLKELEWTIDFKEALGQSVESVRIINSFELSDCFVVGVVDYDSGVGRVILLERDGRTRWMSNPGPLSEVFPGGKSEFVWCLTGYGRFETCMSRLDGEELWKHENMAGVGEVLPDGSLGMLVGSNESPRWDNWEYRHTSSTGQAEPALELKGRCAVRPLLLRDGSLIVCGSAIHLDPSSSRVDYTSFFKMPQEVLFQHLVGIREQGPEYEVFLHKIHPSGLELDIIYHVTGSYSLAMPRQLDKYIVFCDGPDIIGIEA